MGRSACEIEPVSERRCIATGESGPKEGLIRFVVAPDGALTPDLAERLPGRGLWITARADLIDKAVRKKLFAKAARQPAQTPDDLSARLEALILRRLVESLGLARKAGLAVCGFEKTRETLMSHHIAGLFEASNGAEGGKRRLRPLAEEAEIISCLTSAELGLAFGRETVIHAALKAGGAADRVIRESKRLAGFRDRVGGSESTALDDDESRRSDDEAAQWCNEG